MKINSSVELLQGDREKEEGLPVCSIYGSEQSDETNGSDRVHQVRPFAHVLLPRQGLETCTTVSAMLQCLHRYLYFCDGVSDL